MAAYGALLLGLLGMNIKKKLIDVNKYKKNYIEYQPIKNNHDIKVYKKWKQILIKHYLEF